MRNDGMEPQRMLLTRRVFVCATALATTRPLLAWAEDGTVIGTASDVRGEVNRRQSDAPSLLSAGGTILEKDTVSTGLQSFADLKLGADTRILLGSETELLIDQFIADAGGTLELGTGAMVFDRPEGLPPIDLSLRTTFGMIGVRGTKFFCGPSRGVFGVFVEHGLVAVEGGGQVREVAAGQGVNIAAPGDAPTEPAPWGQARIDEAYASVGL